MFQFVKTFAPCLRIREVPTVAAIDLASHNAMSFLIADVCCASTQCLLKGLKSCFVDVKHGSVFAWAYSDKSLRAAARHCFKIETLVSSRSSSPAMFLAKSRSLAFSASKHSARVRIVAVIDPGLYRGSLIFFSFITETVYFLKHLSIYLRLPGIAQGLL